MEYYFFVIIVIIVLKILFWTFYFYARAQRMRQCQTTTQRFIIVRAQPVTRARSNPYSDRSAIIDHAEPVSATGPPPYAEVVKDGGCALPPSYDQAMAGPHPTPFPSTPADSAHARQATATNTPVSGPGPYTGSTAMPGYSLMSSQSATHTAGYPQQFTGQSAPSASAASFTGGQNFIVPQQ